MDTSIPSTLSTCEESEEHNKENEKVTSQEIPDPGDTKEKNNRRSRYYKKPIKKSNYKLQYDFTDTPQEIRRQRLLNYQKKNRNASYNAARGMFAVILNSENDVHEEMEEMEEVQEVAGEEMEKVEEVEEVMDDVDVDESRESEEMEIEEIRKKRPRRYPCYSDKLMMSEWMLEVPQDLTDKWIMVPCPTGKRAIVVAYKGSTKIFSRHGFFMRKFYSALPGGSLKTNIRNLCTILDCIWLKEEKKCYVLDVMVWSSQYMVNCESEFRFFWLKSRMEEIQELTEMKKGINEISFSFLPTINCNQDFYPFLKDISSLFKVDGLLFYHKEAHYTEGRSPLVTWLKVYMLPEALRISIPEEYDEKPNHYIDFQHHIQKVIHNDKLKIQNKNRKKGKRSPKLTTPEKEKEEIVQEKME